MSSEFKVGDEFVRTHTSDSWGVGVAHRQEDYRGTVKRVVDGMGVYDTLDKFHAFAYIDKVKEQPAKQPEFQVGDYVLVNLQGAESITNFVGLAKVSGVNDQHAVVSIVNGWWRNSFSGARKAVAGTIQEVELELLDKLTIY